MNYSWRGEKLNQLFMQFIHCRGFYGTKKNIFNKTKQPNGFSNEYTIPLKLKYLIKLHNSCKNIWEFQLCKSCPIKS